MGDTYEWHITSNTAHVPPLVREILEALRERFDNLTQEEHGDIKLVLNELMFNAVLHGNRADESKQVRVSLTTTKKLVSISIEDEGCGFDSEEALRNMRREDALRLETGRGMTLVNALADEVIYSDAGRKVTILKRIGMRKRMMTGV
jgi:anti-sigma regulatory factor (Ser/Thr protein kinase)